MIRGFLFAAALLAGVGAAAAEREHPPGWNTGGEGYEVFLDRDHALVGGASLRIEQVAPSDAGFALRRVSREQFDGTHLRLSAAIRTREVVSGYAGLWLRFDRGAETLYLDNMRDRGVTGTMDWERFEITAALPADAEWVFYGALLAGGGTAWFDAFHLEVLDADALPEASDEVSAYLDRALNIMERFALRSDAIDWPELRASVLEYARGATALDEAHVVLRNALNRLGDRHSVLLVPREARAWAAGADPAGRPEPLGRMLTPRIAYLEVPRFSGDVAEQVEEYAEQMQRLIQAQAEAGACGWVVDLRGNSGGNMWPMLVGLGPLLGDGVLGGFRGPDGQHAEWWYRNGAAGVGERTAARVTSEPFALPILPPVATLTGPTTASSGEAVALAFQGRGTTQRFGSETAGLTTGNQMFVLSDGALLWLTTSVFVDRDGNEYGGALQPDDGIIPRGVAANPDPVLHAAQVWVSDRCHALASRPSLR